MTEVKKIFIAGSTQLHNAYAYGHTVEGVEAQKICDYIIRELKHYNVRAYRNTLEPYMDLNASAKKANDLKCISYYAIHTNAGGGYGVTAIRQTSPLFTARRKAKSKLMANELCEAIEGLGRHNRGTFGRLGSFGREYYSDLRQPKMASTILEIEFHDNYEGAKWIYENKALIGRTIARRIAKIENLFRIYSMKVRSSDGLNIRSGAGVSFSKVGHLINGAPVSVYEEKLNGDVTWCRISQTEEKWVSKNYLVKI